MSKNRIEINGDFFRITCHKCSGQSLWKTPTIIIRKENDSLDLSIEEINEAENSILHHHSCLEHPVVKRLDQLINPMLGSLL